MTDALLEVRGLRTLFRSDQGTAAAVDGISLHVDRGETLALVGESGCGKSITGLSLMGMVPRPHGRIDGGAVVLEGEDLLQLGNARMRAIRGNRMAMVFQEPMTSLNPVFTIGNQIVEAIRTHRRMRHRDAWARACDLLDLVGIPDPGRRMRDYPHRLSGGMRQRAMIAMAIACDPALLIADEPTTALDVTIQAQILALLQRLQSERRMGMILITHDLGVVAETADRVAVMYAGRIVESGATRQILTAPKHPYTRGLLEAIPQAPAGRGRRGARLAEIPGLVPSLYEMPEGCAFAPRCQRATGICRAVPPPLSPIGEDSHVACYHPG